MSCLYVATLGIFYSSYYINVMTDYSVCVVSLMIFRPALVRYNNSHLNVRSNSVAMLSSQITSRHFWISPMNFSWKTWCCSKSLLKLCPAFLQDEWSRGRVSLLFYMILDYYSIFLIKALCLKFCLCLVSVFSYIYIYCQELLLRDYCHNIKHYLIVFYFKYNWMNCVNIG